jgi:hypothetical protein
MPVMLERWNDDKMDALAADVAGLGSGVGVIDTKVDNLDDQMEKGFARVDTELREQRQETRELRQEMKASFERIDSRFERMQRQLLGACIFIIGTLIALLGHL